MGTWGTGLYDDDEAADLKASIALLSKMPIDSDRLLGILMENRTEPPDFDGDGGPAFWLIVADQFERRGIRNTRAFDRALALIDEGVDLRDQRARDMSEADIAKRSKVLVALKERLLHPRPARTRPRSMRPPPLIVGAGDVLAFPTMRGASINPWCRPSQTPWPVSGNGPFVQDGWGAMLILTTGRTYEWFPWCSYGRLSLSSKTEPTFADAHGACLLIVETAHIGIPRKQHLERLEARFLGRLPLDVTKVRAKIPLMPRNVTAEYVAYVGWSLYQHALERSKDYLSFPIAELVIDE
jgi:hypothetical protein